MTKKKTKKPKHMLKNPNSEIIMTEEQKRLLFPWIDQHRAAIMDALQDPNSTVHYVRKILSRFCGYVYVSVSRIERMSEDVYKNTKVLRKLVMNYEIKHKFQKNTADFIRCWVDPNYVPEQRQDVKNPLTDVTDKMEKLGEAIPDPMKDLKITLSSITAKIPKDIIQETEFSEEHPAKIIERVANGTEMFHDDDATTAGKSGDVVIISVHKRLPELTECGLYDTNDDDTIIVEGLNLEDPEQYAPMIVGRTPMEFFIGDPKVMEETLLKESIKKILDNSDKKEEVKE